MKKNFIKVAFAIAFVAVAGYGVYANQTSSVVSDLVLANVEALANDSEINPDCPNGCESSGSGCYCYEWYDDLHEHDWHDY